MIDVASWLIPCLLLTLVLVGIGLALGRGGPGEGTNRGTRFFLVALRLAIGWHFLFEGVDKLHNPTWSSEPYLRESIGPLAPVFRWLAGDAVLDRLELTADGQLPQELDRDLQAYLDAFAGHYGLDQDQVTRAQGILDQQKAQLLHWLKTFSKPVQLPAAHDPPLIVDWTIPQRIAEYRKLESNLRELEDVLRPRYGKDVFPKIQKAKADLNKWRADLRGDLNAELAQRRKALLDVLYPDQKKISPMEGPVTRPIQWWTPLEASDHMVKYGLIGVGGLLIVGLLTRTACVLGALYLLSFYVAMPPLPTWPDVPRVEGHYVYINKNIIEMLALLVLATTRSGRWAGLDGLLQFFPCCGWRRKSGSVMLERGAGGSPAQDEHRNA